MFAANEDCCVIRRNTRLGERDFKRKLNACQSLRLGGNHKTDSEFRGTINRDGVESNGFFKITYGAKDCYGGISLAAAGSTCLPTTSDWTQPNAVDEGNKARLGAKVVKHRLNSNEDEPVVSLFRGFF